jgi:bacillithiol system protein YtxJ
VSAAAHRAWASFLASPAAREVDHAWVRVIEERPVSLALSDRIGVQHQSPQALLVRDGAAVWNASHHAITAAALQNAATSAGQ